MRIALHNRRTALGFALLAFAGLLAFSAGAQADPGTVNGTAMSLTVSDTTPAPGQTITISETSTYRDFESGGSSSVMGFGTNLGPPPAGFNLAALSLVSGSCTGDYSGCTYNAANTDAFSASVPPGSTGDTVSGTAQFTVSASAADGDTIRFAGFRKTQVGPNNLGTLTSPLTLTVTGPPPAADLGVSLSATPGSLLLGEVDYDVAVHNNGPAAAATSATITTQLGTQVASVGSTTCTFSSTTKRVSCPIGSVANGATAHATFTANYALVTLGTLPATATRTASSPTDNNAANDSDSANCGAVTSLLIIC
jgi:Domain of unknown function DUF11